MRRALILLCFWASAAQAGGWMRMPGTGFFALSGTVDERLNSWTSAYVEYGLNARLTLGAELDIGTALGRPISGAGRVFAQFPLKNRIWASTWHLGVGGREVGGRLRAYASLGASFGRGLNWGKGGWVNFDTRIDLGQGAVSRLKLDATLGLKIAKRSKGMLQLFLTAQNDGTLKTTLAPSYIFSPHKGGQSWQIGLEAKHQKKTELGIKFGLWREF